MPGWKPSSENKILGKPQTRKDGPIKVTGRAKYSYDINLPGLLYGRILRSPHAHAEIVSIDASAAERMPGCKAVILTAGAGKALGYAGDEIGAVACTSSDIAEDAIRAIKVIYKILPHAAQEEAAMKAPSGTVPGRNSNMGRPSSSKRGKAIDEAFKDATVIHEDTYGVAVRTHCSLEPHGVACRWDADDRLTVWASTQDVTGVHNDYVSHYKLPRENVTVITEVMGGGFGSKFGAGYEGFMCADLAKKAGAPVKLLLTREEEQTSVGNAPSAGGHIKIGADASGKIVAFQAHIHGTGGIQGAGVPMPYPVYDVGSHEVEQTSVFTNAGAQRAWRAPGHPQASFLVESAVEDLAVKMNMDPLEVRLKNGTSEIRNAELKEGARLIGWSRRNSRPGVGPLAGTGRYKRGLGCAVSTWGGGGGGPWICKVTISRDGQVVVESGVQDIGTGTRTYVAMIVAEELGLPLDRVRANIGHSNYGPAVGSGGSTTTASTAPMIKKGAEDAKKAFLDAVAPSMGAKGDDLEMGSSNVFLKSDPSKAVPFDTACSALPLAGVVGNGRHDASLQQSGVAGAQFAEVEVDTLLGKVKVIKVVALQDGGIVLNPLTFTSQVNGGIIQGIGMALFEDRIMCQQTGRMVNPNMEEYKMPGPMEMPEFLTLPFENPTARGVSGIGEPPVIPTAAAIRNAIYNACGARVNQAPMTPGRVLAALAAARRGA